MSARVPNLIHRALPKALGATSGSGRFRDSGLPTLRVTGMRILHTLQFCMPEGSGGLTE